MSQPSPLRPELAAAVLACRAGEQVWLAGGAVRDHFLGRPTQDFDFVVAGDARALGRRVADRLGAAYYDLDQERGAGRVISPSADDRRSTLDFTDLRGDDIEQDLRRRDFTINAMGLDLVRPGTPIDPTRGLPDLKDRRLRTCHPGAMAEDPVRCVRAARFAVELELRMEPEAVREIKDAAPGIVSSSAERVRDEVMRLLGQPDPAAGLRLLDRLEVLDRILPELSDLKGFAQPPPHAFDVWEHTLAVVRSLSRLLTVLGGQHDPETSGGIAMGQASLRLGRFRGAVTDHIQRSLSDGRDVRQLLHLAALYHDVAKPRTARLDPQGRLRFLGHEAEGAGMAAQRAASLRLSRAEVERLRVVVANHMRPAQLQASSPVTRRAVYRYFRDLGEAGVDVALLSLADLMGQAAPPVPQPDWQARLEVCRQLLEAYYERRERDVEPPRLVTGQDLMHALGLTQGPVIGRLLEAIREAQAEGSVHTAEEALRLASELLQDPEHGLEASGQGGRM